MKAHYRLSPAKLAWMEKEGFHLTTIPKPGCCDDAPPLPIHHAFGDRRGPFKMLVTLKDGVLLVDPWSIKDDINMAKDTIRGREFHTTYLSKRTEAVLQIKLKRADLEQVTQVVKLPYRAWVVTVNTLGIKVRPSVSDSLKKNYATNTYSGFNLGISAGHSFGHTAFTHRTQISTSHTFSGGLGFSSINLSREPLYTDITVNASQNNFTLSPNLSYTLARNDIGFMLSAGFDVMTGAHADSWLYQRKFFWGFGVSVGLKV